MGQSFATRHIKLIITVIVVIIFVGWWISLANDDYSSGREPVWGVSFGKAQAEYLGLDWKKTYTSLLDDLGVRAVRLAAYWNQIEREQGSYDFKDLDWLVAEAAKRKARIILAIGRRLPRWPECHDPSWVKRMKPEDIAERQLQLVEAVVKRYRDNSSIAMWQVENEYFLGVFGECPKGDPAFFDRELAFVRSLDARPVLVTDSGELSTWRKTAPRGEYLGTTMYRVVWNKWLGYWRYTYLIPPAFYRVRARFVGKPIEHIIGAELQAEPWAPQGMRALSKDEYKQSMAAEQLRANIDFARRTGIPEHYLWGAEYWYYLKTKQNDSELWNTAGEIFGN